MNRVILFAIFSVYLSLSGACSKDNIAVDSSKLQQPTIEPAKKPTEKEIQSALDWLSRHQEKDGHWSAGSFQMQCVDSICSGEGPLEFDAAVSGLALLAFLGAGYTSTDEPIKKAVEWLISQQGIDGCIGRVGGKYIYNHAIATFALAEAYKKAKDVRCEKPLGKAIKYLIDAQNNNMAWRYSYRPGDNDTSVTGWCTLALKSGELAGVKVPPKCYGGALSWIKMVTDENNNYRVGYTAKGTGKVAVRGVNDSWADHDALTAIGMVVRMLIERKKDAKALKGGAERLTGSYTTNILTGSYTKNIPKWYNDDPNGKQIDYYNWFWGTLALYRYDGSSGEYWQKWSIALKDALAPHQEKEGCLAGSWSPEVDRWGFEGGRVYATAINTLTLEIYYGHNLLSGEVVTAGEYLADYDKVIQLNPNDVEAYCNRAIARYEFGDYAGALVDFSKAIQLNPNYAEAYCKRGNANRELGRYKDAITDYSKAIQLKPDYADAYYERGAAKEGGLDYEGAIDDLEKAIELNSPYEDELQLKIDKLREQVK
ncbi:MAG: hypothetical protein A2W23_01505 [Planctomycetes bacterium RBG_16_43_13]|nr:MAG: hypothetical protein A2W23_01505 [Planctomycetes bacterium RBG_16_43_13]